jgi:hypothetical protein
MNGDEEGKTTNVKVEVANFKDKAVKDFHT